MNAPMLAVDKAGARTAINGFMSIWLKLRPRGCEWCGVELESIADLAEWVEWCLQLGELLDPRRKGLPAAKVFCAGCAMGARNELLTGERWMPSLEEDEVPF